jgi:hypothetical protein
MLLSKPLARYSLCCDCPVLVLALCCPCPVLLAPEHDELAEVIFQVVHSTMTQGLMRPPCFRLVKTICNTSHVCSCPVLNAPEHDELAEVISSSGALFTPWQGSWLQALTTTTATDDAQQLVGSSGSSAGDSVQQQQQQQEQPVVPPFVPPVGGETDRVLFESMGMDEERLWAAVGEHDSGCMHTSLPRLACVSHQALAANAQQQPQPPHTGTAVLQL